MRRLSLILALLASCGIVHAQTLNNSPAVNNYIAPTAPAADSSDRVANTSFVKGAFAGLSGDCTATSLLVITCTKTNGSAFATSATTDTTNASNISSGNLADARMPNTTWTTFTPSLACGTATFTVNSAKTKTWGKTTFWEFDATISTLGTCTNSLTATLPNTSNSGGGGAGRETAVAGFAFNCVVTTGTSTLTCSPAPSGTNFAASDRLVASGVYENQ